MVCTLVGVKCVECNAVDLTENLAFIKDVLRGGGKASHNNFSSEPHSSHFLVRVTLKSSSFDYVVLKSLKFLKIKIFFKNLACAYDMESIDGLKYCNNYIMLESSNP